MGGKTVWMVSGNKGGVGKSLFCLALASALEMRGEHYAVLDGDERVGDVYDTFLRKRPARQADFRELRPGSPLCENDIVYSDMLNKLLDASENLIVNTPDGADSTLMKWFDLTLNITETHDYQTKFMYLMSDRPDGLNMLPDLASRFSFLYPVRNRYFGAEDLFVGFNRDHAPMFREVLNLPALNGPELRMLFDAKTYPAEALELKNGRGMHAFPVLSRVRLRAWQALVSEALSDVIDNKKEPNIRLAAD